MYNCLYHLDLSRAPERSLVRASAADCETLSPMSGRTLKQPGSREGARYPGRAGYVLMKVNPTEKEPSSKEALLTFRA